MNVEAADIIGMSHGGVTGLLFALENPRRVRTLTLIEPPAFWVLPNHGYDNVALIRLLPHAEPLELAGGHNAPAAGPEYFVAQWQGFLNRAIARDSRRP